MKYTLFLLFTWVMLFTDFPKLKAQNKEASVTQSIKQETDKIADKLIAIRRSLHENPELAGKEIQTSALIKKHLQDLGLDVKTGLYGNSVIGILKGNKKGKNIGWRAEMDALPHNFPDSVDFKSKNEGVQHGCGHDVHMAIALGIAEVLSKKKKDLAGTVYFIFQPEEETFVGAKAMVDKGLFVQYPLDEIYGLHVAALPVGQILVRPNEMYAYQRRVQIKLQESVTKEQAKYLATKISSALSRAANGSKPWEIQNIVSPKIGLTNPNTIFKNYLIVDDHFANYTKNNTRILETYFYETDANKLKSLLPKTKEIIEASGYKDQLISTSFTQDNPTIMNDTRLTNITIQTLDRLYGKGYVKTSYGQVPYFNDDFAYFQQKISGVYFILGGSNFEKGIIAMNHAPNFRVDEDCIKVGVSSFASLIVERLRSK